MNLIERKKLIGQVTELVSSKKCILKDDLQSKLIRYDTTILNAFFKTLKEYRTQRDYRLRSIEVISNGVVFAK
jgi:hypothetical protein